MSDEHTRAVVYDRQGKVFYMTDVMEYDSPLVGMMKSEIGDFYGEFCALKEAMEVRTEISGLYISLYTTCDKGMIELFDGDLLEQVVKVLEKSIEKDNK